MRSPALSLLLLLALPLASETIWVSPSGDDANAGTESAPVRSLEKARDLARKVDRSEVILAPGVHRLAKSLVLDVRDGGTPDAPRIWKGRPGARISGTVTLPASAWRPAPDDVKERVDGEGAKAALLVADLAGVSLGKRRECGFGVPLLPAQAELYVAGERMTVARWPDVGGKRLHIAKILDRGVGTGATITAEEAGRMARWAEDARPWVSGVFTDDWVWKLWALKGFDASAGTLTFANPDPGGKGFVIAASKHPDTGEIERRDFFHYENLLEEISVPGEYFIDFDRSKIYLYPASHLPPEGVEITVCDEDLLKSEGASNLRFENLSFGPTRGALVAMKGESVVFDRCSFTGSGTFGATMDGRRNLFTRCTFADVGGIALALKGGTIRDPVDSGNRVEDSRFTNHGVRQKVYGPAVQVWDFGQVVRRCRFDGAPHDVVEVRGNDHLIASNLFAAYCLEFRDMGAIYGNGGEKPLHRGIRIEGNVFVSGEKDDLKKNPVYADNGSMGWTVTGNVFLGGAKGVFFNGGGHHVVTGNLFLDVRIPLDVSYIFSSWAKSWRPRYEKAHQALWTSVGDLRPLYEARYPELVGFPGDDVWAPRSILFTSNEIRTSRAFGKDVSETTGALVRGAPDPGLPPMSNAVRTQKDPAEIRSLIDAYRTGARVAKNRDPWVSPEEAGPRADDR